MKKIILSTAAFLLCLSLSAQTTIFEQTSAGIIGSLSGYANLGTPFGIYSADDFSISTQTDIKSVTFYGYQPANDAETLLAGFSLYIYSDASGVPSGNPSVPGTGLLEIINLSPSSPAFTMTHSASTLYDFTVDIVASEGVPLSLSPGTYWILAVPHGNVNGATDPLSKYWYWYYATQNNLSDAVFIDPANFYGQNLTTWTSLVVYSGSPDYDALAFKIMGDNQAAIVDQSPLANSISVFPNPVSNELHLDMPVSLKLKSATIIDLSGKCTKMKIGKDNTLNVSGFASGIYFLQLETSRGTASKKIIKK